jgi:hypothetical protein
LLGIFLIRAIQEIFGESAIQFWAVAFLLISALLLICGHKLGAFPPPHYN